MHFTIECAFCELKKTLCTLFIFLPIQKRTATTSPGTWQTSPQMVEVRYQVKKGSQQMRKVPITTPSVTKALCSFRHDELTLFRSFKAVKNCLYRADT